MEINDLTIGTYLSRPNRFTIEFKDNNNNMNLAHLHDPGRLKELLIPNAKILIKHVPTYKKTKRKTRYDVIGILNNNVWILLNSGYHNKFVNEIIDNEKLEDLKEYHVHKAEVTYGNSRLDFLLKDGNDNELYLEVKGCTLLVGDTAIFPDAPTKRGTKHVEELMEIHSKNIESAILILILHNDAKYFTPNYDTDRDFSSMLKQAYDKKVRIYPLKINTTFKEDTLHLEVDKLLPIIFKEK